MTEKKTKTPQAEAKPKAAPKPKKKEKKPQPHNPSLGKKWYLVDADGLSLGRMATRIATILRGKDKPSFAPDRDEGDFVICINAAKVQLSGRKEEQKIYYRHSGFYGGLKTPLAKDVRARKPTHMIRHAVKGMLPKNRLARRLLTKLKIYAGPQHPHVAQRPEVLTFTKAGK